MKDMFSNFSDSQMKLLKMLGILFLIIEFQFYFNGIYIEIKLKISYNIDIKGGKNYDRYYLFRRKN